MVGFGSVRRLFSLAAVVLFLALPPGDAAARSELDQLDKGPRIGDALPHPLTLADQNNEVRDFPSLRRKKGLILLFSRSFDW